MLSFEQMVLRLVVSLALGALIGLERELLGKDAGIRTSMLVSGGAGLFAMISLVMPEVFNLDPENLNTISDRVVSNIVVGVGFLGGGIILKSGEHVRGLTTAAVVWATAAIGTLVGLGLIKFAFTTALIITGLLYFLRKVGLYEIIRPGKKVESGDDNHVD
ncbi:MAG: MgtC/SapB family protein [Candidatus Liptonbacteria bacterium]|nr:MgtC/SapB family protein [Candidatus Liptonbacteria bacterium]